MSKGCGININISTRRDIHINITTRRDIYINISTKSDSVHKYIHKNRYINKLTGGGIEEFWN